MDEKWIVQLKAKGNKGVDSGWIFFLFNFWSVTVCLMQVNGIRKICGVHCESNFKMMEEPISCLMLLMVFWPWWTWPWVLVAESKHGVTMEGIKG
jgi:hypothetical protein